MYCDSLDKAGELLTALGETLPSELQIDSVEPILGDTSELNRQARERAFGDARAKAEEMAALAGRGVGEVVTIVVEPGQGQPLRRMAAESRAGGAMPFEPGLSSVTAGVRVTWELTGGPG